ncbi:DNA repair exonuclease [Paenibacillus sp. GD4]|uniref:metallophosphoesterase family protein n=1 Tax=Paenibacillus sp. GD4 TaxID=3068890 RepID=UPI002796562C|nr:DNA repair exonuclease [Paenibacillus sp. GD4]MDQ1909742.1 DNA repair exonuclease [Paenibacillus sp. GD4]
MLRFIHAADLHLDSPFRGLTGLPEKLRERVKASTFLALERLVELAVREQADAVLISGDVYDLKDRSLKAQFQFQQAMQTLAGHGIPAFLIHGNHDPLLEGHAARLDWPSTVKVFGCEQVESVVLRNRAGEAVARISGISFGKAAVTENLSLGFRRYEDGLYHIGLLHTNVDGDAAHDNYAPCRRSELAGSGLDYWALGHIHTRAVLQERPWIVYPGNPQGRHIRETGARGCYLVEVDRAGETRLRFEALDDVRWLESVIDAGAAATEQDIKDLLEISLEGLREEAGERAVLVRLVLEGRGPVKEMLRRGGALGELTAYLRGRCLQLQSDMWIVSVEDRTHSPVDQERLRGEPGFLGDLLRLAEELHKDPDGLSGFAQEALEPLLTQQTLRSLLASVNPEELSVWLQEAEELAVELLQADGSGGTG